MMAADHATGAPAPAAAPTPTPTAPAADPAMVLYREKLKLAGALDCRPQLQDLIKANEAVYALERGRVEVEAAVQAAKAAVAEAETLAALAATPDGKNAEDRKLQRERAVQQDPGYQAACAALRGAEDSLARHQAQLDREKREARRIEKEIDYRTAALRYLGG